MYTAFPAHIPPTSTQSSNRNTLAIISDPLFAGAVSSARRLLASSPLAAHRASRPFAPSCSPLQLPRHAAALHSPLRMFTSAASTGCGSPTGCCGHCSEGSSSSAATVGDSTAPAPSSSASSGCANGCFECWKCRNNVQDTMFCKSCGRVQPLACCLQKQTNSFAIFDMTPSFDIDLEALDAAFKNLQRRVHPDSYYSKSKVEAEYALQHASVINVAYQTLKNVSSRAIHLLQLLGHPLTENDRLSDMEFLSDVLDVQEDVETCDVAALRVHAQRNDTRLQRERALASSAFACGRIADAKASVVKLQYLNNITVALEQRLHAIE